MGTGFRIFLVDDDDSLHRVAMARYQRLRRRESGESLPQYAGKRVRCVMVVLEVAGRKPISMNHIDYYMLTFDHEGRVDTAELEKEARLAVEVLPPYIDEEQSGRVLTLPRNATNTNSNGHLPRKYRRQSYPRYSIKSLLELS
jgi:hypothetical protein